MKTEATVSPVNTSASQRTATAAVRWSPLVTVAAEVPKASVLKSIAATAGPRPTASSAFLRTRRVMSGAALGTHRDPY
jgi:hypothetical protein